jgi:hypothetical protein
MTYNPTKEITPTDKLNELINLVIERQPGDEGANWQDNYRFIENFLNRDEEVANCAVDYDGQRVYVALNGDYYSIDDLEKVDARLREMIGRVACFDFRTKSE